MMEQPKKWQDLTPEQQANIDKICEAWIRENVEFNPENPEEFRLRERKDE